jgi:hypothetical protein
MLGFRRTPHSPQPFRASVAMQCRAVVAADTGLQRPHPGGPCRVQEGSWSPLRPLHANTKGVVVRAGSCALICARVCRGGGGRGVEGRCVPLRTRARTLSSPCARCSVACVRLACPPACCPPSIRRAPPSLPSLPVAAGLDQPTPRTQRRRQRQPPQLHRHAHEPTDQRRSRRRHRGRWRQLAYVPGLCGEMVVPADAPVMFADAHPHRPRESDAPPLRVNGIHGCGCVLCGCVQRARRCRSAASRARTASGATSKPRTKPTGTGRMRTAPPPPPRPGTSLGASRAPHRPHGCARRKQVLSCA